MPTATELSRRNTRRFMIGALAVAAVAFIVIAAGGINKNLVYYWTPTDLYANGDKAYGATIRLGGMVSPGSIHNRAGVSGVDFDVHDAGRVVHVKSNGVPPQMFRENIGVVVEGTMTRAGHFESNRLMVSHSNEYRAPGDDPRVDVKNLMNTTSGMEPETKAP
jgi:cytochrome c-type biogenesis protein CcmE